MVETAQLFADFAAWVHAAPRDTEYDYVDTARCPLAQYLADVLGYRNVGVSPFRYFYIDGRDEPARREIPDPVAEALIVQSWTFGALSDRLRAAGY